MKPIFLFLSCIMTFVLSVSAQNPELRIVEDSRSITAIKDIPVVSYAEVLNKATPSVVAVYTSRMILESSYYRRPPLTIQDLLRQFVQPLPQSQPGQKERLERVGVGSGVIISEDGYIVTNYHVVQVQRGQTADEIRVRLNNDTEYIATLVGADEKTDVAVLKIESDEALPAVVVADSSRLRVGDVVFAIGNPLDVGLTATQGIVSALGRDSSGILGPGAYENFIQTDAAINLGNSGGALIDVAGRLIGINTAIVSGSGGSIGIGFAIPSNMVLNVAKSLIETGAVPRGLLGLVPVNLTQDLVEAFNLPSNKGALVNQVQPGSPAEQSGIRHGDVIVGVDDVEIESAQQLRLIISQMRPGSKVNVTLVRQDETLTLPVVLGSLDDPVVGEKLESGILDGVQLRSLDGNLRNRLSVPSGVEGVVIGEVSAKSPYSNIMAPGMIIVEVNGKRVANPSDVGKQLRPGANRLYIWRKGANYYAVIYIQE